MIKAIETEYKGYRFRSRLEARWAVFFTALGIEWEYEPEGFELGDDLRYLPDFFLPEYAYWLEVKPLGNIPSYEKAKLIRFGKLVYSNPIRAIEEGRESFYILQGTPRPGGYQVLTCRLDDESIVDSDSVWTHCPICDRIDITFFQERYGVHTGCLYCEYCDCVDRNWCETLDSWFHKGWIETLNPEFIIGSPLLTPAFTAAQSARFEHGESPQIPTDKERWEILLRNKLEKAEALNSAVDTAIVFDPGDAPALLAKLRKLNTRISLYMQKWKES